MARETTELAAKRWEDLELLQRHYKNFTDFLEDCLHDLLGFTMSPQQEDIGNYLQYGPLRSMIQAQRGQAKTTISGCFVVWCLIHNPTCRSVILSASDSVATEIANWAIQVIMSMPELECMRPDATNRDRTSSHAFDIHNSLKGAEKSPSIACRGITGQLQGLRADLLLADDIEAKSNADTELKREKIREITLDFTSICSTGKIVYLGTPQSVDSTYNTLQDRGYEVRIWPGRFPTEKEVEHYGNCLAPSIIARMKEDPSLHTGGGPTGDRGQPTDPVLFNDEVLTRKEIDQGASHFQLQYMLDTRLMDIGRYPLLVNRLVFTQVQERMPLFLNFAPSTAHQVQWPQGHPLRTTSAYFASGGGTEFSSAFAGTYMYVDPSGGGRHGDELAWAVTKFMAGNIYLVDIGGVPGGLHKENLDALTAIAVKFKPNRIGIEKNYGNGALAQVWRPTLLSKHSCMIEEPWESAQKELRIIDILEPIIGSNRLIIDDKLIDHDWAQCQQYPVDVRNLYSVFYQLAKITRAKAALLHDDRLDALAGACRPWAELLALDAKKAAVSALEEEHRKMKANPLGLPDYALGRTKSTHINSYSVRFNR